VKVTVLLTARDVAVNARTSTEHVALLAPANARR
jgi:hypothetical protein